MLDPRRLATLRVVIRSGSFAAAAHELGYTPAAVSQHITELERSIGLKLLERRPVRPTEAGLVALTAADATYEAIGAANTKLTALRDGDAGTMRLGAFDSAARFIAAPALARLACTHPGIRATLVQMEPAEAHAALVAGAVDIALTFDYDLAPEPLPATLERTHLAEDPMLVALPAAHPLAGEEAIEWRRLADAPWIEAPYAGLALPILRELTGHPALEPALRFEGDDFSTILALVASGVGVALLPRLLLHPAPHTVAVRPLAPEPFSRRLYLDRLRGRKSQPSLAALEQALRESQPGQGS
ncbi:MAG TPA: LysR family transcriptional regulator [Solirubrobacteraceae bacterium]|jgi:DNA-binding transcriptional LysR family regulator|nr:LysR family transcriptional regulator [Solirubrobacteraceae bacterium]